MNSINNFLDETVVLPPGNWEKRHLLSMSEIQELKRKKRLRLEAMEKLKREKAQSKKGILEVKVKEPPKPEKEEKGNTFHPHEFWVGLRSAEKRHFDI